MNCTDPAKILIIESRNDSLSHIKSLLSMFDSEFNVIESVYSSKESIYDIHRFHPDLVLIDDSIDKNTCQDICMKIRLIDGSRHTGIIFVSISEIASEVMLIECLELGADDFIRSNCSERELLARIKAVLRLKSMTDELRKVNHQLKQLSLTDELTGLANMRSFSNKLRQAFKKSSMEKQSFAVIMMDLDHFKKVNDNNNHLVGSSVLREIGDIFREDVHIKNDTDLEEAARYGGDEFVIYKMGVSLEAFKTFLENLRFSIESHKFKGHHKDVRVTASIGAIWLEKGIDCDCSQLIKIADENLYHSKRNGKNRFTLTIIKGENSIPITEPNLRNQSFERFEQGKDKEISSPDKSTIKKTG